MLYLKEALAAVGSTQAELARHLNFSPATVNLINRYDRWPVKPTKAVLAAQILEFLRRRGATAELLARALDHQNKTVVPSPIDTIVPTPEELSMALRKYTLTAETRKHFRIARDPFTNEMASEEDVYLSEDIRYVRAAMRQTARHGGMLAVIGESGGGKSTLRKDLIEWIQAKDEPITIIQPYVLGMDDTENKGRILLAADITGKVIRTLAPHARLRASTQDRAEQMHEILRASGQMGRKHVLIIEEAHRLAIPTLKHLKGFFELEDGFKKLLAIIMIGQTELEEKLSEYNPEVREVVQRTEVVHLPPLDNHVEQYLRHKLERVDAKFDDIIDLGAVEEIRNFLRTTETRKVRGHHTTRVRSLCHPLAVNNLVTAALNQAARIGAPKVNAALIAAAVRSA